MLIASQHLYESTDFGATLDLFGDFTDQNSDGSDNDSDGQTDEGDEFRFTQTFGRTTALAYGGRKEDADQPDVIYLGNLDGQVRVRRPGASEPTLTTAAFPGDAVRDLVLDPGGLRDRLRDRCGACLPHHRRGRRLGRISLETWLPWRTSQPTSWTCTRSRLSRATPWIWSWSGAVNGAYMTTTALPDHWIPVGDNLPNAVVADLDYDRSDKRLVAGTLGRGAWTIDDPYAAAIFAGRTGDVIPVDLGSLGPRRGLRAGVLPGAGRRADPDDDPPTLPSTMKSWYTATTRTGGW
jgi:hypothetical protein